MLTRNVFGYHPHWIGENFHSYDFSLLSHVAYFSAEANPATGTVSSAHNWATTGLIAAAQAAQTKPVLTVTLMGASSNAALLGDAGKRNTLIQTVVGLASAQNAAGITIDFESVPQAQRGNFVAFVSGLAAAARAAIGGVEISAALPAIDWSKAYDAVGLAASCDHLVLMGYDYHYTGSANAGAVAPLDGGMSVRQSVNNYLNLGVAPQKLILGVPYYGYDWPVKDSSGGSATTGKGKAILFKDAKTAAAQNGRNWDDATSSPWYAYQTPQGWRQAWYEDEQSLGVKYSLVNSLNLGGVAIWALSYDGGNADLWNALAAAFSE